MHHHDRFNSSNRLPEWHRQQILEQIVLNPKLHNLGKIPFDWLEGEFLDIDLIQCLEPLQKSHYEITDISPELLEGILRANGIEPDFAKFQAQCLRGIDILDRIDKFKQIHSIDEFNKLSIFVRGMIDHEYRDSEEYKLARELNEIDLETGPVVRIIEEITRLAQYANENRFQLKVPVYKQSANLINLSKHSYDDNEAIRIFRITTEQLGVIPICPTLRETLKLAQDPSTVALRNQIDDWLISLEAGSADRSLAIQKKIRKANDSLLKSSKLKKAGYVSGIIALPVSAFGVFNPFLGAIGLSLSFIAVILERSAKKIETNVKWVGFGSR